MHEMGIANSILEATQKEAHRFPGCRARKVGVRIGEMAAVDAESLRFSIDALTRDTELEGLQLEIESCPRRHHCWNCDSVFVVTNHDCRCPSCQSPDTVCIGGDELELSFVEIDENEPSPLGTESPE
jgi:hydrogenase nickel incorporation protein HypA/HybF